MGTSCKSHKLNGSKRKEIMAFAVKTVMPDPLLTADRVQCEVLLAAYIRSLHTYPAQDLEVLEKYHLATTKHKVCINLPGASYDKYHVDTYAVDSTEWHTERVSRIIVDLDIIPDSTPLVVPHGIMEYSEVVLDGDAAPGLVSNYRAAIIAENHSKYNKLLAYQKVVLSVQTFEELVSVWPEVGALFTSLWPARLPVLVDAKALALVTHDIRKA